MLRLQPFALKSPQSLEEAVELLSRQRGQARILAGGTDLLPNLKHRIYGEVPMLVSLRRIAELQRIERQDDQLILGAGVKLAQLEKSELVREAYPALALTFGEIASPQIRNMATLGGNLCLDTRCTYINQTEFWREALGGCLKALGDVCHVVPKGRNCVAAFSADSPIALIALEAEVDIAGPEGERSLLLAELYNSNGVYHLNLQPGEIVTRVRVPVVPNRKLAFRKWSVRRAIDFPLVNVALRIDTTDSGEIVDAVAVVGVLGAKPRVLDSIEAICAGQTMNPELAEAIGDFVFSKCRPVPNVPYDHLYRRDMLRVQARRAALNLMPGSNLSVRD